MRVCTCTIFFLVGIVSINCLNITSLGGQWTVEDTSKKFVNLTATVPGGIYTDLMNNKIIGNIHYGNNDTATRWVALTNWTYKRDFIVEDALMSYTNINLVFEGLDTFSTILLNDQEIASTENMFRRYIFQAKNYLKVGINKIEVRFLSPVDVAKEQSSKQDYVIPPDCPPDVYNGECHVNQIRKMQASFSWDWGPAFPSVGIWKEVYLETFNSSVIRYVLFITEGKGDLWFINITTYLSSVKGQHVVGKLIHTIQTDVNSIQQIVEVNRTSLDDSGEIKIHFFFSIPKIVVRLWWPNGYGDQKLYDLKTEFLAGSESDSRSRKVGFRKIELVQEPIGSGLSFYFKVNNVPIFAKGANEIPLDILPERGQDPTTISRILESAYATNMNMLRVWGGGVYESDYFYTKTDELGILVWQDFMFACAMYPTHSQFLSNVKEEVSHQVRRLQSHPSVALWAANNENELALMTNWYGTQNNLQKYKEDYLKLYIETVRSEFFNITDGLFLSSSPTNGKKSEEQGFLAPDPANALFGDVHFYNYILDSLNTITYPIPRFASEYGYQSLPDVDSWLTVTNNLEDLKPDSKFMDHRQHHPLGLVENTLLISFQLNLNESVPDFYKTYIFYSQILQAMSIKFETEYYRSLMGRTIEQGRGNTMGALYWQLNDVWVAPTWSGIDYTGKWKMLQYYARDFFSPTIITAFLDITRQLNVYVICDSPTGNSVQVSAKIDVYNWSSFSPVNSTILEVTMGFGKALTVASIQTDAHLQAAGCGSLSEAGKNCFFYLTLMAGNVAIAPFNWMATTPLKYSNLTETSVIVGSIVQIDDVGLKFEVTTSASGISLFVWLDSHQIRGRFSENGYLQLIPSKNVMFEAEAPTSIDEIKKIITVQHYNQFSIAGKT